jgi:hypothetical protein
MFLQPLLQFLLAGLICGFLRRHAPMISRAIESSCKSPQIPYS